MKYTGPIFRPPIEANTLLLQVTVGCAHNKCTFCTMYKDIHFHIETMEQTEKDLKEAKATYSSLKRIFLINGDAFVLSANKLKAIAQKIIEYFPEMEVITMYASIRNIMDKTDEELKMLKEYRVNDLWIGLESGSADVIQHLNKGYTLDDAYTQLTRLNKAQIRHNAIFMIGAAGSGKGIENATYTAKLVNETKPALIGVSTLGIFPGSTLAHEVENGIFTPATELEVMEEEKKLLELIEIDNIPFFGDHPTNAAGLRGILPNDKKRLIDSIDLAITNSSDNFLSGIKSRATL